MPHSLPTHLIGQNEFGVHERGLPEQSHEEPVRMGTTGCAMCVGVALWRESDGKAVVAHIQPDKQTQLAKAVQTLHGLLPNPSKFVCVTAGYHSSTDEIIAALQTKYELNPTIKKGFDEISILTGTGLVRIGRTDLIQTESALPANMQVGLLSRDHPAKD